MSTRDAYARRPASAGQLSAARRSAAAAREKVYQCGYCHGRIAPGRIAEHERACPMKAAVEEQRGHAWRKFVLRWEAAERYRRRQR